MSNNIQEQLLTRIKCIPKFALQIDKPTDVAGSAQLLVSVTYCFMICLLLSDRCIGSDIFMMVNDYFMAEDNTLGNCISIGTNGTATLTGNKKGFQA
jgi:hypothetical protein